MSSKDQFIEDMEKKLDEMRHKVDAVQNDVEKAELVERINYNRMTSELYGKIKDAQMKTDELKMASEENWSKLKSKAEKTWAELEESARDVIEKIKE